MSSQWRLILWRSRHGGVTPRAFARYERAAERGTTRRLSGEACDARAPIGEGDVSAGRQSLMVVRCRDFILSTCWAPPHRVWMRHSCTSCGAAGAARRSDARDAEGIDGRNQQYVAANNRGRAGAGDADALPGGVRACWRRPNASIDSDLNVNSDPNPSLYDLADHPQPSRDAIRAKSIRRSERALANRRMGGRHEHPR